MMTKGLGNASRGWSPLDVKRGPRLCLVMRSKPPELLPLLLDLWKFNLFTDSEEGSSPIARNCSLFPHFQPDPDFIEAVWYSCIAWLLLVK